MISFIQFVFLAVTVGLFVYAAVTDFLSWKIRNQTVLLLIVAIIPVILLSNFAPESVPWRVDFLSSLGSGALLFVVGFILWQFRMFGAGDAKLLFPIGLLLGWDNLLMFAILLVVFALAMLLALKMPLPFRLGATPIGFRIDEIRRTGKIPYGVIMVAATLCLMAVQLFGSPPN